MIKLEDPTAPGEGGGQIVGINQTVWDVATNTLHVESDELLDQHTRYALIVTRGVHDADGQPVEASDEFAAAASRDGIPEKGVVIASVFTTESATAMLEKIRDQIHAATPAVADFLLGPNGERTVFNLDEMSGLTWNQQTRVNGPLNAVPVNVNLLRFIPGTVGQIAFGKYVSPDYETAEQFIPPVGTQTGTPVVQGVNEVFFDLYLPSGPKPAGGWPVAIFGHGSGGSKQGGGPGGGDSLALAASLAEQGIATIAINVVGHGFGPLSTLTVKPSVGAPVTFLEGGRGIDQNGDGIIGNNEGISAAPPRSIIRDRDGQRQTVADLMQLVRVIEVGMDVHGDGLADLDPSRIYYLGQSLGGIYGTEFLAAEPDVRTGVLNVGGGSLTEDFRLHPNVRFVYVDLPPAIRRWKRGQRGVRLYYLLWQRAALQQARRLHCESRFDLVWHLTFANAWSFIDSLRLSSSFGVLVETDRHVEVVRDLAREYPHLSGNRLHDLHIAALMREHGVAEIRTADTHFHEFKFLRVVNPL